MPFLSGEFFIYIFLETNPAHVLNKEKKKGLKLCTYTSHHFSLVSRELLAAGQLYPK